MRKFILLIFTAAAIMFTACEKDNKTDVVQPETQNEASIEFNIEQTGFDFKSLVPECSDLDFDYVKFKMMDSTGLETEYMTGIYLIDGEHLTQVLKLNPGTYHVTSFLVYNDNDTPEEGDDIIVRAAPEIDSEYWDLMEFKLNLEFTVEAFIKKQIEIDVLCFEDLFFEEFGFTWFLFHDVRIERLCFFGDICTGKLQDFMDTELMDSPYADQPEGVQMDMPAIFQVKVYKNNPEAPELLRTFSNEEWLGVGQCLEVYWPNRLDVEGEEFTFELWVMLPSGPIFETRLIYTWDVVDGIGPDTGEDGVVDFVMGSCQYEDSDYILPFWMDLPPDWFNMYTETPALPGPHGTFMDVTFSGIPEGYDIKNQTYGIWCGNFFTPIGSNINYTVKAYNSLAPLTWPADIAINEDVVARLNFFFNKLPMLIPGLEYDDYMDHWYDIQQTIWCLTDGIQPTDPDAIMMCNYVANNYQGYEVPPGGWAAILFWHGTNVQLVFVVVDP